MKAKEFEDTCLKRMQAEQERGRAIMSRYGVQGSFMRGAEPPDFTELASRCTSFPTTVGALGEAFRSGKAAADQWRPVQSLPDFEGVLAPDGRQFIFDAKVSGDASLSLHDSHVAERQRKHLLTRSQFGAICFLLVHFTPRKLKASQQPAETWAFPVSIDHPFWAAFDRSEVKRITRQDCREYAVPVLWNVLPGGRTERPDVLAAVMQLAEMHEPAAV